MEQFVSICLSSFCILTPIAFLVLTGLFYLLGIGTINIPGIARREIRPNKDWITVKDLSRKSSEAVAAVVSLVGTLFGFIGFMLPWVSIDVGAASSFFDLGDLNGTLSGIALAFQSFVAGSGLLASDFEGASVLAMGLIVVGLLVSLIPIALLLSAATGIGLISVPLGLLKMELKRLARGLLVLSVLSLCLSCAFFAGVQATIGGVKVGGAEDLFGSSISLGAEVANGFWITVGGMILALVGAVFANTLAGSLANWAYGLTTLEKDIAEKEVEETNKS